MTQWIKCNDKLINLNKVNFISIEDAELIFYFEQLNATWGFKHKYELIAVLSKIEKILGINPTPYTLEQTEC